jgi:hypothetical protein
MKTMNWKEINKMPTEKYGWFAVATLPRNHSGSGEKDSTDLAGDNSWRKSFGFTKAWFNNGEWYEADPIGYRNNNITRFVTHWDYLPEVPMLSESFKHLSNWRLNERPNKEQMRELAIKEWEKEQKINPNPVNSEDYSYGFIAALQFIGLR